MSPKNGDIELDVVSTGSTDKQDDLALARLGKKAVLKRRFGFLSILGFSCTVLITWEASLVLFLVGFQNGGPAGVIYGYIVVWAGTVSVFIVLSELVSMAPTSGGQYHWVSMLAPQNSKVLLSYVSGWLSLCGWLASLGSGAFLTGGLIQGLIMLCRPTSYVPQNWHVTLFYWAIIAFCIFINVGAGWLLPKFEGSLLFLHILGFFAILIPLLVMGPQGDAKEIFTTFFEYGRLEESGIELLCGHHGERVCFRGDGPIHLSEEIQNAQVVVPRSIMIGIAMNGTLGFGMLLTVLFRMGDLSSVLAENPAFPFMAIFHRAVQSRSGAAVMASLVMLSTSRICWAFARDKGLPGWRTLSKVSSRTQIPRLRRSLHKHNRLPPRPHQHRLHTAFNGIISVAIAGLFSSYLLTCSLLLYRRCTGGIVSQPDHSHVPSTTNPTAIPSSSISQTTRPYAVWGPWRLPAALGIANNAFAFFWPSFAQVTVQNMNWAVLVTSVIAGMSIVYYVVWARKVYRGPVVEVDVVREGCWSEG
ncbi:amino acid permease-domain-containing protein [Bipolaris maydis]|nr:amino acid permease-domain-containing protein [Bipolaris maydis]